MRAARRPVAQGVLADRLSQKTSVAAVYVLAMFISIMNAIRKRDT
jgi:hypothetical protein